MHGPFRERSGMNVKQPWHGSRRRPRRGDVSGTTKVCDAGSTLSCSLYLASRTRRAKAKATATATATATVNAAVETLLWRSPSCWDSMTGSKNKRAVKAHWGAGQISGPQACWRQALRLSTTARRAEPLLNKTVCMHHPGTPLSTPTVHSAVVGKCDHVPPMPPVHANGTADARILYGHRLQIGCECQQAKYPRGCIRQTSRRRSAAGSVDILLPKGACFRLSMCTCGCVGGCVGAAPGELPFFRSRLAYRRRCCALRPDHKQRLSALWCNLILYCTSPTSMRSGLPRSMAVAAGS